MSSNLKIQVNLRKSMLNQLELFTLSGFLISCQKYEFRAKLRDLARSSHHCFLIMCEILNEKMNKKVRDKNKFSLTLQQRISSCQSLTQLKKEINEIKPLASVDLK